MTNFSQLGLPEPLLAAVTAAGYETPTPIQAGAIPVLLQGRDLIGIARTGTGKTAAFCLPILARLMVSPGVPAPRSVRALILAPTRELATQIQDSVRRYAAGTRLRSAVIIGGVKAGPQVEMLAKGVDVLIATPGRLMDHVRSNAVDLSRTPIVVLDEADHMLDLGFIPDVRKILSKLPRQRQTMLFSATMPQEIRGLAAEFQTNPAEIAVTPVAATAEKVAQHLIWTPARSKSAVLAEELQKPEVTRALVFSRTKHGANKLAAQLDAAGIGTLAIHGNKSQAARERALGAFRKGVLKVLVATDVAARGIDVEGVSHVFNVDLPEVPETYVHRIGRTARAGAAGRAISIVDPSEQGLLRAIERLIRQRLESEDRMGDRAPAPLPPAVVARDELETRSHGGRGSAGRGQRRGESGGERRESGFGGERRGRSGGGERRESGYSADGGERRESGYSADGGERGMARRIGGPARPGARRSGGGGGRSRSSGGGRGSMAA